MPVVPSFSEMVKLAKRLPAETAIHRGQGGGPEGPGRALQLMFTAGSEGKMRMTSMPATDVEEYWYPAGGTGGTDPLCPSSAYKLGLPTVGVTTIVKDCRDEKFAT